MSRVKIVVYVPVSHADVVRQALGDVGAGKIGNYNFCSFSVRGTGRFLPNEQARPMVGSAGVLEEVEEDRIEVTCDGALLDAALAAMRSVHPYEEIAYDVYALLN